MPVRSHTRWPPKLVKKEVLKKKKKEVLLKHLQQAEQNVVLESNSFHLNTSSCQVLKALNRIPVLKGKQN